ncbi:restriction endonuclease [Enterococcus faecalis]|uniref:restriction endonuclease n=1 Tax=Enterococcus faecalis TaxID=1351 RepID=UPI001784D333|nr:restriction endonuclease [Enterococcus faecalis]MBD9844887.1 restriction endonuclease [Enterococcus faecalis]
MFEFLTSIKKKKYVEENLFLKDKKEIRSLSFVKNADEEVVIEFLNNIDKSFNSDKKGRLAQGTYFEVFLASVFRLAGFDVKITPKRYIRNGRVYTGDDNVDLILRKGSEKIAVQAKHFRLNVKAPRIITKDNVFRFCGMDDKEYTKKLFITTTLFNQSVYEEIEKNEKAKKIEWYDRYGLLQLLNQLIPETMGKYLLLNSLPASVEKCPDCESGFVLTKWSDKNHNYFKGCTMYPICNHTESIK